MNDEQRRLELAHFVEDLGMFFEQNGLPRMAGRILGYLLVADPPHQSAEHLKTALQASKGSISTMTRLLIQVGFIERITLPGDRRDYFRMKNNAWTELNRRRIGQITAFRMLAERGLMLLADRPPEQRKRLEEMHDLFAWFERELPALIERYERERESRAARDES